ncbi:hypothetical protein C8R43DRAFT_622367 [Mycena crocata]|nr:hypothetical protein C8R43DRAFT_622367 [Mycena crocata]
MSMNCQFSFGPNRSYFCSADSVYAWSDSNLPQGLARLLEDRNHPQAMETPYDVAFPMEAGLYALCWKTTRGEDWYEDGCLGQNYARLARFIKSVATRGGYTTRTVFGPGASYFSMSPSGYSWQNVAPALEDDIHSCMKIRRPTSVALGVGGSYVVLYNDGTVTFDLRGYYPIVEALIRNTHEAGRRRGVMYIALNPFVAGEYYAVYGDGSAAWNFPTAWSADVTAISREIKPVPPPPPAVSTPGGTGGTISPGGTGGAVSPGGTGPAPIAVQPVQVSSGGTSPTPTLAAAASASRISVGSVAASIASSVGSAVQSVVAQELAPSAAPPAYAPLAYVPPSAPSPAPSHIQQAPSPAPSAQHIVHHNLPSGAASPSPPSSPAPKMTWQEGLSMGLKAVEGVNKIMDVFGDSNQQNQAQNQQAQQDNSSSFNLAGMQAGLFDQVFVQQQTTYDVGDGTVTVETDTTTWQTAQ